MYFKNLDFQVYDQTLPYPKQATFFHAEKCETHGTPRRLYQTVLRRNAALGYNLACLKKKIQTVLGTVLLGPRAFNSGSWIIKLQFL